MLQCHVKQCNSFPLIPSECSLELTEPTATPEFIQNIIPKLDWKALYTTALALNLQHLLPETLPEPERYSEEFIQKLTTLLLGVDIVEGKLNCVVCLKVFEINGGIANMLLSEVDL